MASLKVACVVVVTCMVVMSAPMAHAGIACEEIAELITPCLDYLENGGMPPAACCNGLRSLGTTAATTVDRQTACICLKNLANNMGEKLIVQNSASIQTKCGVNTPFEISTSTSCASINMF